MLRWQNSRLFFTWIEREIDVGEETHSDNLPKKTENEMLAGFEQILGTDVDHGATDSGGGIDCKVEIFLFSVNALFWWKFYLKRKLLSESKIFFS